MIVREHEIASQKIRTGMKAVLAVFLVCAVLIMLPSTASAQSACDPQVQQIQSRFGQAMKIRNQGVTSQVVVRNDSALQLSCFDQAMALTSNAGQIFSDGFPSAGALAALLDVGSQPGVGSYAYPFGAIPPPIAALASLFGITLPAGRGGVTIPLGGGSSITLPVPGVTNFLMFQITNTVGSTLDNMQSQFVGGLVNQLFGTLTSQITTILVNYFTVLLGTYTLGTLSSILGININLTSIIRSLISGLTGKIFGSSGTSSMLDCQGMGTVWKTGVVGLGIKPQAPYYTLNNFLGGATLGTWPGAGANMTLKYGGAANKSILIQANTDRGILVSPRPSHPPIPVLPPLSSVANVIGAM